MRFMECLDIRPKQIGTEKKENYKFTNVHLLNLLMLFPFFVVRQYSRAVCSGQDMGTDTGYNPEKRRDDFCQCQRTTFCSH